jgi:hypothetical protein
MAKKKCSVIDSLLYENIPGKIISKTIITRNGYTGIDLTNRTRRGDMQRYNIFITPFEIIVFKMSGTGDYVMSGDEAKRFFTSIRLKEFNHAVSPSATWKKYSPPYGGFAVSLPHEPYIGNDGSWIYDAEDRSANTQYRVIRSDIHNYRFVEEDTFDLGLMDESFSSSEFIAKPETRRHITWKGYPGLDANYKDKTGGVYLVRYIIQGPHYYTLIAHGRQETPAMKNFLNSFEIKPYSYREPRERKDTSLYYSVKSPVFPATDKEKLDMPGYGFLTGEEDNESEEEALVNGTTRTKIITDDSTGEKVFVSFYKMPRYVYLKDSLFMDKQNQEIFYGDTTAILLRNKKYTLPGKLLVWEYVATDTGSSRALWTKTFFKDGIVYSLMTLSDTLTQPSPFVQSFFDTFTPVDTLTSLSPFRKKSDLFFDDFMSVDSIVHRRAVNGLPLLEFDSTDLPRLKKAIVAVNWNEKKYLDLKKDLIGKLDDIKTKESSDLLRELYFAAGDTVELQHATLEILLQQQTAYAFGIFRDIIANEPPVLDIGNDNKWLSFPGSFHFDNGNFMDELYDSLGLTKTILADLLPLVNLDEYKYAVMKLLGRLVDSNLIKAKDYEIYFSKFLLEAKQELRKQAVLEKTKAIDKAQKEKEDGKADILLYGQEKKDDGNDKLSLYATLLLPFQENKTSVQPVIAQMLSSGDRNLKYQTLLLLLRNNKPVPDSLLGYFAGLDEYRYTLYNDLKELKMDAKFPLQYRNQRDLGISKLLAEQPFGSPDSLVFIEKLPAETKNRKGSVFFYKYKNKKDDMSWKLAVLGLVPDDPALIEFEEDEETEYEFDYSMLNDKYAVSGYDFAYFSDKRIKEDQPIGEQLKKELKKIVYSWRKSAKEFYKDEEENYVEVNVEEEN